MNILKTFLINIIVFLLLLEILGYISISFYHLGLPPNFILFQNHAIVLDSDKTFGVWHPKNVKTKSYGPCWQVDYNINKFGNRDKDYEIKSSRNRILFLGDSFFEGYGVEYEQRFQQILEKKYKFEALTFATSGNFGPTQMELLYESFASKFDHNSLVISFFPSNDFNDDDENMGINDINYKNRYRPYFIKNSQSGYDLKYIKDSLNKSEWYAGSYKPKAAKALFSEIIKSNENAINKLNSLNKNFSFGRAFVSLLIKKSFSLFQNTQIEKSLIFQKINSEKLNKYFFVLDKVVKKTKGKKIALVLIPHTLDLLNHDQDLLSPVIQKYCVQNGIIFINLKEKFSTFKDHKNITLPCDGHWSPEGHKIVSQILEKELTNFL